MWVVTPRENGLTDTLEIWRREEEHSNMAKQSAQALQVFIYLPAPRRALLLDLEVLTPSTDQESYLEVKINSGNSCKHLKPFGQYLQEVRAFPRLFSLLYDYSQIFLWGDSSVQVRSSSEIKGTKTTTLLLYPIPLLPCFTLCKYLHHWKSHPS